MPVLPFVKDAVHNSYGQHFLVQSRGVVWWAPDFLQLMCWSADLQLALGRSEAKCEVIWVRTRHGS